MSKTRVMGILNVTPDSCYDQGRYFEHDLAIARGLDIAREGADLIDIGGESTRPGASPVCVEKELERVIPVIEALRGQQCLLPLSIDTFKWQVAEAAVKLGVSMINDITGFADSSMCAVAVEHDVEVCLMHMQGMPQTMQTNPQYPEGVVEHLLRWFSERIEKLLALGIAQERIYLDPGIGFGKTIAHNLEIIQNLPRLKKLGFHLLLGLSRKSFMGKITGQGYAELLPATIAMNTVACLAEVDVIRVHDVGEHRAVVDLMNAYLNQ
jgi:dihydropteroate synthase